MKSAPISSVQVLHGGAGGVRLSYRDAHQLFEQRSATINDPLRKQLQGLTITEKKAKICDQ